MTSSASLFARRLPWPLLSGDPGPRSFAVRIASQKTLDAIAGGALHLRQIEPFDGERGAVGGRFDERVFGPLRRDAEGRLRLELWANEEPQAQPQATRFGRLVLPAAVVHPWVLRVAERGAETSEAERVAKTLCDVARVKRVYCEGRLVAPHEVAPGVRWLAGGDAVAALVEAGALPTEALSAVLRVLPLLPAGLRPVIDTPDRKMRHDADVLYELVQGHAARVERLKSLNLPSGMPLATELRFFQRAVDALFLHGARWEDDADRGSVCVPCVEGETARILSLHHLLNAVRGWPQEVDALVRDVPSRPFSKRWYARAYLARAWIEASALEVVPRGARDTLDENAYDLSLLDRRLRTMHDVYVERFGEGTRYLEDTPGDGAAPPIGVFVSPPLPDGSRWLLTLGMSAEAMPDDPLPLRPAPRSPRAELAMRVPAGLDPAMLQHLAMGLRALARYPFVNKTFLAELHSLSVGRPIAPGSSLTSFVLVRPTDPAVIALSDGLPSSPAFLVAIGISEAELTRLGASAEREGAAAEIARRTGEVTDPSRAEMLPPAAPAAASFPPPGASSPPPPPGDQGARAATDGAPALSPGLVYDHESACSALARAVSPFAALVRLLNVELDLAENALDLVQKEGAPVDLFHGTVASALTTLRALIAGWPREHARSRIAITWPDGRSFVGTARRTEAAASIPFVGGRWIQALAIAWIAGDQALARELADEALVGTLREHRQEKEVPSRHRRLLWEALAALALGERLGDAKKIAKAIADDADRPKQGVTGIALHPVALRSKVAPIVPVLAALDALAAPGTSGGDASHLAAALEDAFKRATSEAPASLLLAGLAALARSKAPAGRWLENGGLLPSGALRGGTVTVSPLAPIPALDDGGIVLGTVQLERLAEALWQASGPEIWTAAWGMTPLSVARRLTIHLVEHGAWAPMNRFQAHQLASALSALTDPGEAVGPSLGAAAIVPLLGALGGAGLSTSDPEDVRVMRAVVPVIARAYRGAPEALGAAQLAPWLSGVVQISRAIAGEVLGGAEGKEAFATAAALVEGALSGTDVLVVADEAGRTEPAGRAALAKALARIGGPGWASGLSQTHPLRALDDTSQRLQKRKEAMARDRAIVLVGDAARKGRRPTPGDLASIGAAGRAALPQIEPRYAALIEELGRGRSIEAARAALALRSLAAHALDRDGGPIGEAEARFLVREPAVFDALPEAERGAAEEEERKARSRLGDRLHGAARVAVVRSWTPEPAAPVAPSPSPSSSGRTRKIVSRR